jgi:hypothetical protein
MNDDELARLDSAASRESHSPKAEYGSEAERDQLSRTIEQILVTPARPLELMVSKIAATT